ncbi:MAG: hypothetical protein ACTSQI_07770 [Candidatus Helarchaeota archaeon]
MIKAYISEKDERYPLWQYIMGTDRPEVPLKHPFPIAHKDGKDIFQGDIEALTEDQKKRLIEKMSEKFNIPEKEVEQDLRKGIFPVIASGWWSDEPIFL